VPPHCGSCGSKVITVCEECSAAIPVPDYLNNIDWPNPFCVGCGTPFPWATREQLIERLYSLIDEDELSPSDRLSVIEEIAILSTPEKPENVSERVRAAERFRQLAPVAWGLRQPILRLALSDEVLQLIQRLPQ